MQNELACLVDRDRGEEAVRLIPMDLDGRKRAEIALAGEKQLLEMIASGRPLPDVLDALCRFFETAAPGCVCGVYPIEWSGPRFQNAVAPSLPGSYLAPVEGLPVRLDVAPCGIAALERSQVIVEDIASDPRWNESSYRDHVLAHGLRSVWSTPISSLEGRVLGTFCIYRRNPATPSAHVQELIAQITHIASIAIDRARNEAALKRSEAFLAQAQKLSLTGSFGWTVDEDPHFWSDETFRIFGYDPGIPITVRLALQRVHPQDLDFVRQVIARTNEARDIDVEYRLMMPDGTVKHVHVVAQASRDQHGRIEYIGAIQDVTQQRRSEEALGKLRSELAHVARVTSLGALTASIAHEVNQPLSGIVTNASTSLRMLAADPPNVEGARETARRSIRDANRAADVITRLRALFAKKAPTVELMDLNAATREVIALWRSELQRSRATLRAELADELPRVMGDRVQLQQVIINLLRNASEAMSGVDDRPRIIVIRTGLDGPHEVILSVQDAGVGFDQNGVDKLFEAFYTTKHDGMGIGLSVSRSIIESHGGRLWAALNDGPGVTFSFSIPHFSEAGIVTNGHRAVVPGA
jgi:PAS domain S-box-containing protein